MIESDIKYKGCITSEWKSKMVFIEIEWAIKLKILIILKCKCSNLACNNMLNYVNSSSMYAKIGDNHYSILFWQGWKQFKAPY